MSAGVDNNEDIDNDEQRHLTAPQDIGEQGFRAVLRDMMEDEEDDLIPMDTMDPAPIGAAWSPMKLSDIFDFESPLLLWTSCFAAQPSRNLDAEETLYDLADMGPADAEAVADVVPRDGTEISLLDHNTTGILTS
ncbi:hypothetical protein K488DRAFT_90797 [Vararia minispora EC-137]|uniref:Uncharacterized protein n=1 Tax=Vararia minispora EC-137 TaxID=1314806 RepID=A0ACB8Q728_9AGAM|nr:hypothetical protein K488DRAFT_90797 [Vararia minispora EC-137]